MSHKACEMGFCGLEQNDRLQPSKGEDVAKTSRQTAPGRLGISGPTHFAVRGRTDATPNHFIVSLLHKRAIVVDELCAFPYSLPEQPPSVQRRVQVILPIARRGRVNNPRYKLQHFNTMANFIASIDQGTTSTRCMIFNHAGESVGIEQLEHQQIYPKPGWVEHDPAEIWHAHRM